MDGAAEITQRPIQPGETYVYEFTARQHGTYFYHSHREPDRQQGLGMYGALIIDPKDHSAKPDYDLEYTVQLQEWLYREGHTFPAMVMEGAMPNYFTINGKAYPATETIHLKVGQKLLLRFIGSQNNFIHPRCTFTAGRSPSLRPTATLCQRRPGSKRIRSTSARVSAMT
jgi:FtsP/CotA-like multicopper oxidase with cupredoxin domain